MDVFKRAELEKLNLGVRVYKNLGFLTYSSLKFLIIKIEKLSYYRYYNYFSSNFNFT